MISSTLSQGNSNPLSSLKNVNASTVSEGKGNSAGKAKASQKSAKSSPAKTEQTSHSEKPNKNMIEVDAYLKMISKFEKLMGEGEIGDKELNNMFSAMEKKILEMENPNKRKLLNLNFFKEHGIKNINDLKQSLIEIFEDEQQQQKGIEFLKSEGFTSLLLKKPQSSPTYSNQGKVAQAKNEKQEAHFKMPPLKASSENYMSPKVNSASLTSIRA